MDTTKEAIILLPVDVVKTVVGFSIDIGGSVCKVVYRHKDDWEELLNTKPEPTRAKLRLVQIRREEADKAFQLLQEKCHITRTVDNPTPLVYTTGVGSSPVRSKLEKLLGVRVTNLVESGCIADGFDYLSKNLPVDEFTIPISRGIIEDACKQARVQVDALKLEGHQSERQRIPQYSIPRALGSTDAVEYPVVVVSCGSAFVSRKLEQYGNEMVTTLYDCAWHGGRAFIGLGSLLVGAKTYDEVIDLASDGDTSKTDLFHLDLAKYLSEDGHVNAHEGLDHVEIAHYNPRDLALSLLKTQAHLIAQTVVQAAQESGCQHAFLSGGFFSRDYVRDVVTQAIIYKMTMVNSTQAEELDFGFHFIRNSAFVGAIGALLRPLLK